MASLNIILPDLFYSQLLTEADLCQTKVSTLIAECIEEHYSDPSKAEYEKRLQKCKEENIVLWHTIDQFKQDTVENAASQDVVVKGLQNELEPAKKDVKNLSEQVADLKGKIQGLERDKKHL
ncbi:MAG: hypothetical protein ACXV5E_07905 [Halobacteriota archaeon]